jgi:hypothetical protein
MYKHTRTLNRYSFTTSNDGAIGFEARPKSMDDISFSFLRIWTKIRITSLRPFAYFIPRDGSRPLYIQRYLQIDAKIGSDSIRFREFSVRTGVVGYRKLVRLARSFVAPRRRGNEIADIN